MAPLSAELFLLGNVAIGLSPWALHGLARLAAMLIGTTLGARLYKDAPA